MNIPVAFPFVPTSRYSRKFSQLRLPTPFDLAKSKVYWLSALPTGGLKWTRTTDLPLIRRVL